MKFRFDDQPHQATAQESVTDLFESALLPPTHMVAGQAAGGSGHSSFTLDQELLADNLAQVTSREDVGVQRALLLLESTDLRGFKRASPNFSVEMETGTGKTYVYISTALRLAELYGLRKFVILVHSVAIRAGVVKTFEQTADHFASKFPGLPYTWGTLGEGPALADFTEPSSKVRFMIASVQAIDKPDTNSVYQQAEQPQLWGEATTGITAIAALRPVVIADEPQNMATDLRRRAISTLNPLFVLRYSATHREPFNLVHRLSAKQANELGLVKRVSVKGVVAGAAGEAYVLVTAIKAVKRRLSAEAVVDVVGSNGSRRQTVILLPGSDLFEMTKLDAYRGMVVESLERKPDRIILAGGKIIVKGVETGVDHDAIWKDQLRHTIRQHIARQDQLNQSDRSVKVLSLFFVERVGDYVGLDAKLPSMFDVLYREEWVRAGRAEVDCPDPSTLRTSYFASTKTGIIKDTSGRATDSELEARAYNEIIMNKELILTKDNPRAFIFSHSALREGWDNPNVFQVCFFRHTRSDLERRQQVGRGLRLPVDETGARVMDPGICRLTVVVDESFAEFREGLNREYLAAGGGGGDGPPDPDDADSEVVVRRRKSVFSSPEFAELWARIRYKARYRVTLDAAVLPAAVAKSEILGEINYLNKRGNLVQAAELIYDDRGNVITSDDSVSEERGESISVVGRTLPDLVQLVEDQLLSTKFPLQLTRPTTAKIIGALAESVQSKSINDPDRWARIVALAIRTATIEEMVSHISYEPMSKAEWWDAEVVFLESEVVTSTVASLESNHGIEPAKAGGTNLFDHTIYDSLVERAFASQLDNDSNVKMFTKLPRRFRVKTPVGEYSPDWAVVYEQDGQTRLYLVRETKGTLNLHDLEWDEGMRIRFASQHFIAAPEGPVDYTHTTDTDGLRISS